MEKHQKSDVAKEALNGNTRSDVAKKALNGNKRKVMQQRRH